MQAYRQTFRRHRALLIAPVVVATLIAAWFSFGAAPVYRSSASLWVDNSPAVGSAMDGALSGTGSTASASEIDPSGGGAGSPTTAANVPNGPAGLEAQVIYELMLSPGFDVGVGRGSLLPRFLESGGSAGGFSPSVLLSHRVGSVPAGLADEAAAGWVPSGVTAWAAGPQVLVLSYDGPTPAVSQSVLRSLIKQIGAAGGTFGDSIGKTASSFYRQRLAAASTEAVSNQGALATYARQHPSATDENDATYRALANEVKLANQALASAQVASGQADKEATSGNGGSATIKVIDQPTLPTAPMKGLTSELMGALGGTFAGAVLSLLALILLTPRGQRRWDADVPFFARLAAWDASNGRRRRFSATPRADGAPRRPDLPGQQEPA